MVANLRRNRLEGRGLSLVERLITAVAIDTDLTAPGQ